MYILYTHIQYQVEIKLSVVCMKNSAFFNWGKKGSFIGNSEFLVRRQTNCPSLKRKVFVFSLIHQSWNPEHLQPWNCRKVNPLPSLMCLVINFQTSGSLNTKSKHVLISSTDKSMAAKQSNISLWIITLKVWNEIWYVKFPKFLTLCKAVKCYKNQIQPDHLIQSLHSR